MKRLLRRWKLILGILIVLPFALLGIAQWIVSSQLSPEALVRRIESSLNCRVEVASASANLFSLPARIEINGLKLAARDADADNAKPLKDRSAIDPKQASIAIDHASLKLDLWKLLTGSIAVKDILVQNVNFISQTSATGASTVSIMLDDPAIIEGQPNPKAKKPPAPAPAVADATKPPKTKEPKEPKAPEPERPIHVSKIPFASSATSIRVEHVRFDSKSEKRKELIRWEDGTFVIDDLQINPSDLSKSNHAKLNLDGRFQVLGKRKVYHADLGLHLAGDFSPFDPATGNLNSLPVVVKIDKGSTLQDVPALRRVSEKMKKWEKHGLKFEPLPDNAIFIQDATTTLSYGGGKITVLSPLGIDLDNYRVDLDAGGWITLSDNQCALVLRITASKPISDKALKDFAAFLNDKTGGTLGNSLFDKATAIFKSENLLLADGRVSIPMKLTGDLGKPEVEDDLEPRLEKALFQMLIPGV